MNTRMTRIKKNAIKIILAGIIFLSFHFTAEAKELNFNDVKKNIEINDNGVQYEVFSSANTVDEILKEKRINLNDNDLIFPAKNEKIYSGANIIIFRAKKITIKEGGNSTIVYTFQNTVEQAIWENKDIKFDEDDITVPARTSTIKGGEIISITHVLIKEEVKKLDIEYKTISNEDEKLGWRVKKVTQKGEKGVKEVKYKVVYNDGKEISRKILESNVVKDPVNEVVTQGTHVEVGKVHTGAASWYAFTGTLSAANPWLPIGSYVRVTNKANGKQVIVRINDRGPFGAGRIIDLDKVAFAQIASIGAGVVDVKMEVITN